MSAPVLDSMEPPRLPVETSALGDPEPTHTAGLIDVEALGNARRDNVKRDDQGRYLLPDPEGGYERAWTRTTTVTKTLEDTYNLELWKLRMAAVGLKLSPEILAQIPREVPDTKAGKRDLNLLVEDAQKAAGMGKRADLGTLLHTCTEEIDHGRATPADFPDPYRDDLFAYVELVQKARLRLFPDYIERIVINPMVDAAGTIDRIGATPDTNLRIIDVKTGSELFFPRMGYAAQFGTYANATHMYDQDSGDLQPMVPVDLDWGLIIHLPAGEARCSLHWVDLRKGWRVARASHEARRMRQDQLYILPTTPEHLIAQADVLDSIRLAPTVDELNALWRTTEPLWTALHLEEAKTRKAQLTAST
jgi:hypothetical protein